MSDDPEVEVFLSPLSPDLESPESARGINTVLHSIERSRKRHLSEGLLRGDLAADRLLLQEAGASPLLKKQKSNMAMTMQEFRQYMDENTNKKLKSVEESMLEVNKVVARVNKNVKVNTAKLDKHENMIKENSDSIAALKQEMSRRETTARQPTPGPPTDEMTPDLEFLRARRSLRLWPIHGTSKEEMWNATEFFIKRNLCLENQIAESMIESISRVEIPSGPGVKLEVLVLFKSEMCRDTVMGAAAKLATFIDDRRRPTAGMRIEVPTRLQPVFRTLYRFGQSLRSRHGAGTRRHVKFDDAALTLYLNVKLPGDERWSRVSFEAARRALRAKQSREDNDMEQRFDLMGAAATDRPRAASTSSAIPTPQDARMDTSTSTWTGRRTESVNLD